MKYLLLLPLLVSCEALATPIYDETGQPAMIETPNEIVIPVGDQGDTVTVIPNPTPPRPATLGDSVATVAAQVLGAATGNPLLMAIGGPILGLFLGRRRRTA